MKCMNKIENTPTEPVFLTSKERTASIIFNWICMLYKSGRFKITEGVDDETINQGVCRPDYTHTDRDM